MEIQKTVAAVVTVSMARLVLLLLVTTDFLQELLRLWQSLQPSFCSAYSSFSAADARFARELPFVTGGSVHSKLESVALDISETTRVLASRRPFAVALEQTFIMTRFEISLRRLCL